MSDAGGQGPRAGRRAAVLGVRKATAERAAGAGAFAGRTVERLANGLRAEADAGRLMPWLVVCFGSGILIYFSAPFEPSPWAGLAALPVFVTVAVLSRERPAWFALSLVLLSISAGFGIATIRAAQVSHPILTRPTGTVTITGFVEVRDATERSERVVLRVTGASGRGAGEVADRVRIAFRRGMAPAVGEHIEARARLLPLLGPLRPGGYDYARGAYFRGLGATGFAFGRARTVPAAEPVPLTIRVRTVIDRMRWSLTNRIRTVVPGEAGAIAAALVTGVRDAISPAVNEAMRISGLYHMLSISGLHMALVAGALFALIRGGLALVPGLALRKPIKKWAAVAALTGVTFYLVLSGAEVATQRSYIMIVIVLAGVLADRPAITVRTLSAAALGVLLIQPEALLNPSFQMSFAATLALVALYERVVPFMAAPPTQGGGALAHFLARAMRWILLGAATSLFAGLATTAYVAFHFHRVAPYSVMANLLAMPLISFVIMPMGLIASLLLPFGYDIYGWKLMGAGIEGMLKIADWVAALPGADGRFGAFGAGALLLATAGLLVLALPATRIRFAGIGFIAAAFVLALGAPKPDVLVDASGRTVALRTASGQLAILDARRARFAAEGWLAADADGRKAGADLAKPFSCDEAGCVARLPDGTVVAVARDHSAFADDCRQAVLIVSRLDVPAACAAPVIDRRTLATTGAVALRRVDGRWIAEAARSPHSDRPWYGRVRVPDAAALQRVQARSMEKAAAATTGAWAGPGDFPVSGSPDEEPDPHLDQ